MTKLDALPNGHHGEQLICVVDDDASVRAAIVRVLKSVGFAASSFSSAEDFLRFKDMSRTGCLILDVRMKGMSGLELQSFLSESGVRIPTVFISAHADLDAKKRAMQAGAIGFLPKPFRNEDLLGLLAAAFAQAR